MPGLIDFFRKPKPKRSPEIQKDVEQLLAEEILILSQLYRSPISDEDKADLRYYILSPRLHITEQYKVNIDRRDIRAALESAASDMPGQTAAIPSFAIGKSEEEITQVENEMRLAAKDRLSRRSWR